MNSKEEQIEIISNVINSTKENLKPLSVNFIFWGSLIVLMSLIHYLFPNYIQSSKYSSLLFWTVLPILGMICTVIYNIKIRKVVGYETYLNRVIKIIWGIFNLSWLIIIIMSVNGGNNPVPEILFLLSTTLIMTGLIIKFKPIVVGGILLILFTVYINFNPNINFLMVNIIGVSLGMLVPGISLYISKANE